MCFPKAPKLNAPQQAPTTIVEQTTPRPTNTEALTAAEAQGAPVVEGEENVDQPKKKGKGTNALIIPLSGSNSGSVGFPV